VSDFPRGRIHPFSIDTLVNMLAKAGIRVTATVRGRIRAAQRLGPKLPSTWRLPGAARPGEAWTPPPIDSATAP